MKNKLKLLAEKISESSSRALESLRKTIDIKAAFRLITTCYKKMICSVSRISLIRKINFTLSMLSIILLLILLTDLLSRGDSGSLDLPVDSGKIASLTPTGVHETSFGPDGNSFVASRLKPYSYYNTVIMKRNIFKPNSSGEPQEKPPKRPIRLTELSSSLSVMGIFLDENPSAIIYDSKSNTSYTVSEGQYLNDILIIKIDRGKVVLSSKDEEMNLVF